MQTETEYQLQDPGPLKGFGRLETGLFVLVVIGLATVLAGLSQDRTRLCYNYLIEYFFFLALGLSGLVLTAVHYTAGATWSVTVRRIAEGLSAYLPLALVLTLPLFPIMSKLYTWALPETVHLYHGKHIYLNRGFMMGRMFFDFFIWIWLGSKIVRNSLRGDDSGQVSLYHRNRTLSPVFLLLFALTFTFLSVDLLMSLEENWYSTMFPLYTFSGLFLSGFSLVAVIIVLLRKAGYTREAILPHHLHDLGTWIMAFSCFMVYIGFSQYMLIWYANIPIETIYLFKRSVNGWGWLFAVLPLLKWLLPFVALMPSRLRSNENVLLVVGLGVLLGQWLDIYWMVVPTFSESFRMVGWMEIGMFLGFAGLFGLSLARFYRSHSLVAWRDPRVDECLKGRYLHV